MPNCKPEAQAAGALFAVREFAARDERAVFVGDPRPRATRMTNAQVRAREFCMHLQARARAANSNLGEEFWPIWTARDLGLPILERAIQAAVEDERIQVNQQSLADEFVRLMLEPGASQSI